jgi:uncharacterized protein GlcG (DUF336 family)
MAPITQPTQLGAPLPKGDQHAQQTRLTHDDGGHTAFLSAPDLEGMLEGGVAIVVDGHCVGAVGVSGVKAPEDAQVAQAGRTA